MLSLLIVGCAVLGSVLVYLSVHAAGTANAVGLSVGGVVFLVVAFYSAGRLLLRLHADGC